MLLPPQLLLPTEVVGEAALIRVSSIGVAVKGRGPVVGVVKEVFLVVLPTYRGISDLHNNIGQSGQKLKCVLSLSIFAVSNGHQKVRHFALVAIAQGK